VVVGEDGRKAAAAVAGGLQVRRRRMRRTWREEELWWQRPRSGTSGQQWCGCAQRRRVSSKWQPWLELEVALGGGGGGAAVAAGGEVVGRG